MEEFFPNAIKVDNELTTDEGNESLLSRDDIKYSKLQLLISQNLNEWFSVSPLPSREVYGVSYGSLTAKINNVGDLSIPIKLWYTFNAVKNTNFGV